MTSFRPWIRKYNYVSDYFNNVYETYIKQYPAFPVNYYKLNFSESVYDQNELGAGTYEKLGVGSLSGFVWDKIVMLPIFGIEPIFLQQDSGDAGGMNFRESALSTMLIPDIYGFTPVENDFVDLSFGIKSSNNYNRAIYTISDVNPAHFGDELHLFKCNLRISPFEKADLEKQINKYYMFYEPMKEILPITNASLLSKLTSKSDIIRTNLNNLFNSQVSFYLKELNV